MRGFWRKKGKDEKSDQSDKKESKQDARRTCFCENRNEIQDKQKEVEKQSNITREQSSL